MDYGISYSVVQAYVTKVIGHQLVRSMRLTATHCSQNYNGMRNFLGIKTKASVPIFLLTLIE